ncbi:uncharacterized protein LOC127802000 isoform X1 [Diospyros lotus]|uniref:uncharacterized protein LOC127802000 isoform X1 n=1 Tax=Diospyros lotus TaxID=55363 RepID=UPI0022551A63|nr:uncharacterized protein LOC127802000 isoform X1 [Diospyros lotus]
MAWRQMMSSFNPRTLSTPLHSFAGLATFSSKSAPRIVKVGIPEFLNGVGKGVEAHVEKLESEIGDFQKLLVTRTLKLKKLGIPCKHVWVFAIIRAAFFLGNFIVGAVILERKLILKYTHKYRVGLWRPQGVPVKS